MHRIEVGFTSKNLDSVAVSVESDIKEDLEIAQPMQVRFAEIYYLDFGIDREKAAEIAQKVMLDLIVQEFSVDENLYKGDFIVEVGLKPGVTDNLAIITQEAIGDFLGQKPEGSIKTAKKYYFSGTVQRKTIGKIASELLANDAIEEFQIFQGDLK